MVGTIVLCVCVLPVFNVFHCSKLLSVTETSITALRGSCVPMIRVIQLFFNGRYLSAVGFVNDMMIPEVLQVQQYALTDRFSQDHLELRFNAITASGRILLIIISSFVMSCE